MNIKRLATGFIPMSALVLAIGTGVGVGYVDAVNDCEVLQAKTTQISASYNSRVDNAVKWLNESAEDETFSKAHSAEIAGLKEILKTAQSYDLMESCSLTEQGRADMEENVANFERISDNLAENTTALSNTYYEHVLTVAKDEFNKAVETGKATASKAQEMAEKLPEGDEMRTDLENKTNALNTAVGAENKTAQEFKSATAKINESERAVSDKMSEIEDFIAKLREQRAQAVSNASYGSYDGGYSDGGYYGGYSGGYSGGGASNHYLSVWDCGGGDGQACVDAGGVSYKDYRSYGGPQWIGGHNYGSAGSILNYQIGDTITVGGSSAAGTYRITGDQWVSKDGHCVDEFGTGYVFQTCGDGDSMRLVHAEKIG